MKKTNYIIKENIADIGSVGIKQDWIIKVNVIDWNNCGDNIDIRAWKGSSYSDGITFNFETARKLMYALADWYGVEIQDIND